MAEITLQTGKKVVVREELSAYHDFLMASFIDVPMLDSNNKPTAAYLLKAGILDTLFRVEAVNGQPIDTPTEQKSLIVAFSHFTSTELTELQQKMRQVGPEGNGGTEDLGSESAPSSSSTV